MSQDPFTLTDFGGTARIFPLPNLVLFPHVAQPLHIFEPRYRQLMADALEDDRLIALALLQPGWEEDYHKTPPIYPTVCLGRIHQDEHLPDGRYNLLLQGLCRMRVVEELKTDRLYRVARVDLVSDVVVATEEKEQELRDDLRQGVTPFFSAHPPAMEELKRLPESPIPLGSLCDIFSFALPLEVELKQALLDESNIEARIRRLLLGLEGRTPPTPRKVPQRPFPPGFSDN